MKKNIIRHDMIPVFEFDSKANRVIAYFEELPEYIASGVDEKDAENNLADLIEDMRNKNNK